MRPCSAGECACSSGLPATGRPGNLSQHIQGAQLGHALGQRRQARLRLWTRVPSKPLGNTKKKICRSGRDPALRVQRCTFVCQPSLAAATILYILARTSRLAETMGATSTVQTHMCHVIAVSVAWHGHGLGRVGGGYLAAVVGAGGQVQQQAQTRRCCEACKDCWKPSGMVWWSSGCRQVARPACLGGTAGTPAAVEKWPAPNIRKLVALIPHMLTYCAKQCMIAMSN